MTLEQHGRCTGLRLGLGGKHQLEVWCCPKGEEIAPHRHEHIDSFIVALYGRQRWTVGRRAEDGGQMAEGGGRKSEITRTVLGPVRRRVSNGRLTWAAQSIPRGMRHGFTALSFSMFLNLERTTRGVSASEDFVSCP